jgi:hypothetical protein
MDTQPKKSFIKKFWWIGAIIFILCLIGVGLNVFNKDKNAPTVAEIGPGEGTNVPPPTQAPVDNYVPPEETKSKFGVYPQTSDAPVLHMYWNTAKTVEIPLTEIQYVGRIGLWEGGGNIPGGFKLGKEPATEMEIHTYNKRQPVYALASGTLTELKINNDGVTEISIRYGTDYAVKYCHVVDYNKDLTVNSKVEAGDLLGYARRFEMTDQPSFGFWELEFNKKVGETARAVPAVDYFDAESKASLEKLPAKFGHSGWVVDANDKNAGWVAYVGKPEAWASSNSFEIPGDNPKDYYSQFGMDFIFNDELD